MDCSLRSYDRNAFTSDNMPTTTAPLLLLMTSSRVR